MSWSDLPGFRREWVYPLAPSGRFTRIRQVVGHVLIGVLLALPWIPVDGRPALNLDLASRRLFAFGAIFTPRDSIILVVLGLFIAFLLFFVTSRWGRIWCGYGCPQTVFLESWVRPLEEWIEGTRAKRMQLDRGRWSWDKIWRKSLKNGIIALWSFGLGLALVAFLVPPWTLFAFDGPPAAYGVVAVLGVGIFLDLAWFREQFCSFLCPYARFLGALTDDDSLTVAYEVHLGEPRRSRPRATPEGACIDCKKCVAVCPQGIDIREGFQLDCINCARCVDACQGVMDRLGQPEPLIRYTATRGQGTPWRPRTLVYGALLVVLGVAFIGLMSQRTTLDASITRAPGTLFTLDTDGLVRNTYLLQITNNSDEPARPTVTVEGFELTVTPIDVPPGESRTVPLVLRADPAGLPRTVKLEVHVDDLDLDTTFKSGAST